MPSLGQKLVGGLAAPRPARISLNDGRFTLFMDSGEQHPNILPAMSIQVIFVGGNSHVSKCFYDEDKYDKDAPNSPKCWSDNGVAPSDQVATPVSQTCAVCPNNSWVGTGATATPPACKDRKKTAVLVSGAGDTVFLLDLPPASLKPFRKYMAYLGGEVREEPEHVLTNLTMNDRVLQFSTAGHVADEVRPHIRKIVDNPATDDVVNEHDRPTQMKLAAPAEKIHVDEDGVISGPDRGPILRTYPAHIHTPPTEMPAPKLVRGYMSDERSPPPAGEPVVQPFAQPLTAEQAEKQTRKPRADKGVPRTAFIQPAPPAASFGMQADPPSPPPDVSEMLTKAFGLRTGQ